MKEQKTTSFISVFIKGFLMFCGLVILGLVIIYFVVLPSPPNRTNFRIYSADKTQCVTIITQGNSRYFINGEYNSIPKSEYIKVDKSGITLIEDEIGICWKNENYVWEIVNHKSKIIEIKIDTLKFKFNTSWETDKYGTPNAKKYRTDNCGTIGLETMKNYSENIIIEN